MQLKKTLNDKEETRVSAWYFGNNEFCGNENEVGLALGSYKKGEVDMKSIAAIGMFNGQKKLIINMERAKELGFEVCYE